MGINNRKLVSVIVPVYNVEQFLERSVESIVNQTYKNLEIILVDDGSPDGCSKLCDELAEKDPRIRVVHKPNGGLSDARNAGMAVASGDFIYFMDSDDFIIPNCIELHLNAIVQTGADFSVANIKVEGSKTLVLKKINPNLDVNNPMKSFFRKDWDVSGCNKMFNLKFLKGNSLSFEKGLIHEDILWSFKLAEKANKIAVVNEDTYIYMIRQDSITTKTVKSKKIDSLIHIFNEMGNDWSNNVVNHNLSYEFGAFYDYWRFYAALAILRLAEGNKVKYYNEICSLAISNASSNKFKALLSMPYWMFCSIFKPVLKGYKFVQTRA